MKKFYIFVSFLFISGLFSVNAQDMIILRDGNIIEAKVMEIYPTEIRYKRINNLDGPMIVIPKDNVLSIKYESGELEIINASSAPGHERNQTSGAVSYDGQQHSTPTPLQTILNTLPAIPIAGNNLKFQFAGDKWTAMVNGENFSAGNVEVKDTDNGSILTLKQTHIWPGAVGRTAGRIAGRIPGASAVGGVLNTAGSIAGAVGAIESSGPEIVLEYKAGPPASLRLVSRGSGRESGRDNQALQFDSDYQNFTLGQRWGTFFLNQLIPGVGSFAIMKDKKGGGVQLGIGLTSLAFLGVFFIGDITVTKIFVCSAGGAGFGLANFIFNIVRSASYDRPYPVLSLVNPECWQVAMLPGENGIETVALSYTIRY